MGKRWTWFTLFAVLLVGASGSWVFREDLKDRYLLWRLRRGPESESDARVAALAGRAGRLQEPLLGWLRDGNRGDCARASSVLAAWAEGNADARSLVRWLHDEFKSLGPAGQCAALELATRLAARLSDDERAGCRSLAALACRQSDDGVRLRAACLASRCGASLVPAVVPLLDDPSPDVRRAAILAVAAHRELVGDEDLLRWLHDPDVEVRSLCATALRGRGLSSQAVAMGRLLCSPRVAERLRVFEHLAVDAEVDPVLWLNRLSQDADPAVRAAAARFAADRHLHGLIERVAHMAAADPDPTVRRNARYYHGRFPALRSTGGER